jgi:hypothetical protein
MRKHSSLLILSFIALSLSSQNFNRPGDWKKYRKEIYASIGISEFLGDLGGRDRVGTDNSPVDINFRSTRSAMGIGYKYKFARWFNVATNFNYLVVRADDALTNNPARKNRNLNFKSNILEVGGRVEIGWQNNRFGHRYGIKRTLSKRLKNNNQSFFLFAGVSGFYFNPKGKAPWGAWVKLRPLHTEGQGLPGGPKQYSNYSVCIPMGFYYRTILNKTWSLGLEFSWRKTFTNYIDDVGQNYYDNAAIAKAYGPIAAIMADPNLGLIPGATKPSVDRPAQRGDTDFDSYLSLQVTVGYVFKTKRKRARLRSKF